MLRQVELGEEPVVEDDIPNTDTDIVSNTPLSKTIDKLTRNNTTNENNTSDRQNPFITYNKKMQVIASHKIYHFFEKLKKYQKQKEERVNKYRRNIEIINNNSMTPIPTISNRSKKIASCLNQTTEERLLEQKRSLLNELDSKVDRRSLLRKSLGPPSCFYATRSVEEPKPIVQDPSINSNTGQLCKQKYMKEINYSLAILNKQKIDYEVFLIFLKNIGFNIEGKAKYDKAITLWNYIEELKATTAYQLSELLCQLLTYSSSIKEESQKKIAQIAKEIVDSRLIYRKQTQFSCIDTSKNTQVLSKITKRLASIYRNKIMKSNNAKTIDLYEMSKEYSKCKLTKIKQLQDHIESNINMSCTFKPQTLTSRNNSVSNVKSSSFISNAQELTSRIRSNEKANDDTKNTVSQTTRFKRITTNTTLSQLQGCIQAVERIKKGNQERVRKAQNTQLRSTASKEIKISSKPCIFIEINIGKGRCERIEVYEKDNPAKIAKQFIKANSMSLTRIGFDL